MRRVGGIGSTRRDQAKVEVVTFEDLRAEYADSRIGPIIWGLVVELSRNVARRYPPEVYNEGAPWSDDSVEELAQQVVLDRLLSEAQLEYLFDQATSIESWRKLLTLQIRRTLSRRRRKTVVDRLLARVRKLAQTIPFRLHAVGQAVWISHRDSSAPLVDLPSHRIGELANLVRDIPHLTTSPRSSRASMVYTTADLRLLVERIVDQVDVVSERDLSRILEDLLTSWLPTFLQYPERDYPSDEPSPEAAVEEMGINRALRAFVYDLSAEERWIVLSKSQGIADGEIAIRLSRSRPWVARQKQNVLRRLETELVSELESARHSLVMERLLALISESLEDRAE